MKNMEILHRFTAAAKTARCGQGIIVYVTLTNGLEPCIKYTVELCSDCNIYVGTDMYFPTFSRVVTVHTLLGRSTNDKKPCMQCRKELVIYRPADECHKCSVVFDELYSEMTATSGTGISGNNRIMELEDYKFYHLQSNVDADYDRINAKVEQEIQEELRRQAIAARHDETQRSS